MYHIPPLPFHRIAPGLKNLLRWNTSEKKNAPSEPSTKNSGHPADSGGQLGASKAPFSLGPIRSQHGHSAAVAFIPRALRRRIALSLDRARRRRAFGGGPAPEDGRDFFGGLRPRGPGGLHGA